MSKFIQACFLEILQSQLISSAVEQMHLKTQRSANSSVSSGAFAELLQMMLKTQFNPKDLLTTREREVLQLICEEFTNIEICKKLFLSPRSIESYRKNMLEKIGARNTAGLVVFALKNDLVDLKG